MLLLFLPHINSGFPFRMKHHTLSLSSCLDTIAISTPPKADRPHTPPYPCSRNFEDRAKTRPCHVRLHIFRDADMKSSCCCLKKEERERRAVCMQFARCLLEKEQTSLTAMSPSEKRRMDRCTRKEGKQGEKAGIYTPTRLKGSAPGIKGVWGVFRSPGFKRTAKQERCCRLLALGQIT
jgi:hypothetical protein